MSTEEKERVIKVFARNGDWNKVYKLYEELYPEPEFQPDLGEDWDPAPGILLTQKAFLLSEYGKMAEAMKIYRTCEDMSIRKARSTTGRGTQNMRQRIGDILFKQKKYDEALTVLNDVLERQIQILGNGIEKLKPDPHETRLIIANILEAQGKFSDAMEMYEKAHEAYVELYGSESEITVDIGFNITSLKLKIAAATEGDMDLDKILKIVGYGSSVFSVKDNPDESDADEPEEGMDTVLHRAVRTNILHIIQTVFDGLVEKCEAENDDDKLVAFLNFKNSELHTPLTLAVHYQCENAVKYLLENGITLGLDAEIITKVQYTDLFRRTFRPVAEGGSRVIQELLLKHTDAVELLPDTTE